MPNEHELTPYEDQSGKRGVDPETIAGIKRHLEAVPDADPQLPPLTPSEAIAQARAALNRAHEDNQ